MKLFRSLVKQCLKSIDIIMEVDGTTSLLFGERSSPKVTGTCHPQVHRNEMLSFGECRLGCPTGLRCSQRSGLVDPGRLPIDCRVQILLKA